LRASLFIPCLAQDFYPSVGEAAARVLAGAGVRLDYPSGQTCCGQPVYKSGRFGTARNLAKRFIEIFEHAEAVVAPSGSCVHMVKTYPGLFAEDPGWLQRAENLAHRVYEFSQFLVDVVGVTDLGAEFEATAVYHRSCQVARALGVLAQPLALLDNVRGLRLLDLADPEACCGFGGTFSLRYPEISEAVLESKIEDILATGAKYVISPEISCMMNIGAYLEKSGSPVGVLHIAEVLDKRGGRAR